MNPQQIADLAKGWLRNKRTELEKALDGYFSEHHRLILRVSIQILASYDMAIEELNREIDQRMEPYEEISERIQTIPGVKEH